jgi:hypothetical protein
MALQSAKNVTVAFKVEGTYNTPPGDTGAKFMRFTPSQGLTLSAAVIRSNEQRADALTTMGRKGSQQVTGTYTSEASLGSHDDIYEAVMRATWQAALVITEATVGGPDEITTEANAIVGANGSWIAAGLKIGDVIRLTGHSVGANNSRNLRISGLTATRIETIETLVAEGVADTTFTITRGRKLSNPITPVKRTFHVEQRSVDVDGSQLFGGARWTGMKITGSPDGMAELEFTMLGASQDVRTGVDSPYFTTPTLFNSVPLVFADAKIGFDGEDIDVATAFELTYTINAATQPVVGSIVSPDVFDNDASMEGTFTMIRKDFENVRRFVEEEEFRLHILLTEPVAEPKPYISFFVPRNKFTDASAPLGGDGAMLETLPFQIGAQSGTDALDATLMTICTSYTP